MTEIVLGYATDPRLDPETLDGMFRLRHVVFKERLGWNVASVDGRERDHYDDLGPVYMVSRAGRRVVDGCWRMLPTIGPYMLKDTFPELLRGEPAPAREDVWELSRFAVAPASADDRRQAHFGGATLAMMREAFAFGVREGISRYVTVTSVALERMLRRVGLPLRRFGDGKALRIGKVLSVACWIDVNEESRAALHPARVAETVRKEAA